MFYFKKIFSLFSYTILLFFLLFYVQLLILDKPFTNHIQGCQEDFTLIWWTPFVHGEKKIQCGNNICCFVTENRKWRNRTNTAFLFYGSFFNVYDLPLPRTNAIWGLLHEESPRNSPHLNHEPILNLFNYSSTFSRFSNFPLTLQYLTSLKNLTSRSYYKTFEEKNHLNFSDVIYIQSDCITPNNRDSYVTELMKYIRIDSYGACLNNRRLPKSLSNALETMMSSELLQLIGNYKFAVAFENAICDDYITEKLWRPLIAGSIPLYIGSPSVMDWLPNINAVIFPSDYSSPKELANYLHYLSSHEEPYNNHLKHKIEHKIHNEFLIKNFLYNEGLLKSDTFVTEFECMICKKMYNNHSSVITKRHYNCQQPISMLTNKINISNWWHIDFFKNEYEAIVVRKYIDNLVPFDPLKLEALVMRYIKKLKFQIN